MKLIKSEVSHLEFTAGRQVRKAIHREDNSAGIIIGEVDDDKARDTDTVIDQSEYQELSVALKNINDSLPPEETPPPTRYRVLKVMLEDDPTDDEADSIIREMVRIERRGR